MEHEEIMPKIKQLSEDLAACSKMLTAIGDETRQHLILEMIKTGNCSGVRVGTITERTNLSHPAVSHHLKIMKEAGLVKMRKEGTMNFYYFDPETETLERLVNALLMAAEITKSLPDRSEEAFWEHDGQNK